MSPVQPERSSLTTLRPPIIRAAFIGRSHSEWNMKANSDRTNKLDPTSSGAPQRFYRVAQLPLPMKMKKQINNPYFGQPSLLAFPLFSALALIATMALAAARADAQQYSI